MDYIKDYFMEAYKNNVRDAIDSYLYRVITQSIRHDETMLGITNKYNEEIKERIDYMPSDMLSYRMREPLKFYMLSNPMPQKIKKVLFNPPATIVIWEDGSKTVVQCQNNEPFDKEKGLAMCIIKKLYGNKGKYNNILKEWCE